MLEDTKFCFHEATFLDQGGSKRTLRVPVVQELARHGLENIPKMFVNASLDTLDSNQIPCSPTDFPSVSMAKLLAVEERQSELSKLAAGAKEWGMVLVRDHGVPISLLGGVQEVVKGFFDMSFEEKKKSVGTYGSIDNMGYGRNFINPKNQPIDWIDRLTMKASPRGSTDGLNVWPQNPTKFREVFESYVEEAKKVCDELLQALAESLSLDKNSFIQYFDPNTREINIRVNYYPPCPEPNLTLSFNPHTDASALSLLVQFGSSGTLQVMHNNKWLTVPWPRDALLVNVGDLLEIMSHGRVESPWHRVVAQADVERYSVATFFNPPSSIEIEPVKGDTLNGNVYKKVVVSDYLRHVYKISPTTSKEAIKFAMHDRSEN